MLPELELLLGVRLEQSSVIPFLRVNLFGDIERSVVKTAEFTGKLDIGAKVRLDFLRLGLDLLSELGFQMGGEILHFDFFMKPFRAMRVAVLAAGRTSCVLLDFFHNLGEFAKVDLGQVQLVLLAGSRGRLAAFALVFPRSVKRQAFP